MRCHGCQNGVGDDARYCGNCGLAVASAERCANCHYPRNLEQRFCERCGLDHKLPDRDDSFLEQAAKRVLRTLRVRRIGFTHRLMWSGACPFGLEQDGWAAEEMAYLVGLLLTYGILFLFSVPLPEHTVGMWALVLFAVYRVFDILSYELEIVLLARPEDVARRDGHVLSVERRVLCIFIHLLDFIGCYAILYIAISKFQTSAFTEGLFNSSVEALYFSIIVASFTGLSETYPKTDWARLVVSSEIILNLVLFVTLFSTVIGSIQRLKQMTPRPLRASRHAINHPSLPGSSHGDGGAHSDERGNTVAETK